MGRIRGPAPWVLLAASFATCSVFGTTGLNVPALDALGACGVLAAGAWVLVRWGRRLAAHRRFRRQGGAVIACQDGPTVAELAGEVRDVRRQLADHQAAWEAIGREDDPESRRSRMHSVRDRGA